MVAVEGADDMRNLLKVNHVWWLLQNNCNWSVRTSDSIVPLSQKGEKSTIDLPDSGAGHEGKNYKIS